MTLFSNNFVAIIFLLISYDTHQLDKGAYWLADHLWVCDDQSVSAFSSQFHLERVTDIENLNILLLLKLHDRKRN